MIQRPTSAIFTSYCMRTFLCFFTYLIRKLLMSAVFGTGGETQVTSMVSGPTCPKAKSVGAGTAAGKTEQTVGFMRFLIGCETGFGKFNNSTKGCKRKDKHKGTTKRESEIFTRPSFKRRVCDVFVCQCKSSSEVLQHLQAERTSTVCTGGGWEGKP